MNIVLISEKETCVFAWGQSKIFYRRMSPAKAREIRELHTQNGVTNVEAVGFDGLKYCVTGWENVRDHNGGEVKFSQELLDFLPGKVREDLVNRCIDGDVTDDLRKQEGN